MTDISTFSFDLAAPGQVSTDSTPGMNVPEPVAQSRFSQLVNPMGNKLQPLMQTQGKKSAQSIIRNFIKSTSFPSALVPTQLNIAEQTKKEYDKALYEYMAWPAGSGARSHREPLGTMGRFALSKLTTGFQNYYNCNPDRLAELMTHPQFEKLAAGQKVISWDTWSEWVQQVFPDPEAVFNGVRTNYAALHQALFTFSIWQLAIGLQKFYKSHKDKVGDLMTLERFRKLRGEDVELSIPKLMQWVEQEYANPINLFKGSVTAYQKLHLMIMPKQEQKSIASMTKIPPAMLLQTGLKEYYSVDSDKMMELLLAPGFQLVWGEPGEPEVMKWARVVSQVFPDVTIVLGAGQRIQYQLAHRIMLELTAPEPEPEPPQLTPEPSAIASEVAESEHGGPQSEKSKTNLGQDLVSTTPDPDAVPELGNVEIGIKPDDTSQDEMSGDVDAAGNPVKKASKKDALKKKKASRKKLTRSSSDKETSDGEQKSSGKSKKRGSKVKKGKASKELGMAGTVIEEGVEEGNDEGENEGEDDDDDGEFYSDDESLDMDPRRDDDFGWGDPEPEPESESEPEPEPEVPTRKGLSKSISKKGAQNETSAANTKAAGGKSLQTKASLQHKAKDDFEFNVDTNQADMHDEGQVFTSAGHRRLLDPKSRRTSNPEYSPRAPGNQESVTPMTPSNLPSIVSPTSAPGGAADLKSRGSRRTSAPEISLQSHRPPETSRSNPSPLASSKLHSAPPLMSAASRLGGLRGSLGREVGRSFGQSGVESERGAAAMAGPGRSLGLGRLPMISKTFLTPEQRREQKEQREAETKARLQEMLAAKKEKQRIAAEKKSQMTQEKANRRTSVIKAAEAEEAVYKWVDRAELDWSLLKQRLTERKKKKNNVFTEALMKDLACMISIAIFSGAGNDMEWPCKDNRFWMYEDGSAQNPGKFKEGMIQCRRKISVVVNDTHWERRLFTCNTAQLQEILIAANEHIYETLEKDFLSKESSKQSLEDERNKQGLTRGQDELPGTSSRSEFMNESPNSSRIRTSLKFDGTRAELFGDTSQQQSTSKNPLSPHRVATSIREQRRSQPSTFQNGYFLS